MLDHKLSSSLSLFLLVVCQFIFLPAARTQTVSVSTNAVVQGGTVVANWSGFGGNVNVEVWKGSAFWVYANTNVAGSGSQNLGTSGWELRADYRVKVVLRSNTNINAYSTYFSVSQPSVSVSPSSVVQGGTVTASWSGFSENVNVEVWKGGTFWVYANTNISGSGSQGLNTTEWEIRSDYRSRVALRSNANINQFSSYFSVTSPPLPDLTVSSVSGPSTGNINQSISTSVTVSRTGGQLTNGTYVQVQVFLSPDATINTSDILIGTSTSSQFLNSTLNSSGTASATISCLLPNTAATYYIGAIADPGNFHPESDDNNNSRAGNTIQIGRLTIISPNGGEVVTKGTAYNIQWTQSNVSGNVYIELRKGGVFQSPPITTTAPTNGPFSWTPATTLPDGNDYTIAISAMSGNCWDLGDGNFSLVGAPTPVPTLTYPPNGGSVGFDLTPDLAWTHPGATRFWGQIDNNSNFSSLEGENTNIQAFGWTPTLTSNGVYYWRIKALGTNGVWSDWSNVWSFTIGALAPALQLPTSNQTITTNEISFQWSNVHASRYELYVDNNSGFGSPEVSPLSIPAFNNFTDVTYILTGNWLGQNVYYWKVRAYFPSGPFIESSVGTFTYQPPKDPQPNWVPIYRAYYPTDVDHFYCTNSTHLAQAQSGGYIFEKVDGYLATHPFEAGNDLRAVYRFYVGQDMSHYYTSDEIDRDNKIIAGWIYEGITGYGLANARPGLVKMFYAYLDNTSNHALRDHFYTISQIERDNAFARGYQDRGMLAYVSPDGDSSTQAWMRGQMMLGEGINSQNGNFNHFTKTSFSIPGSRMSLDFAHIYNSYSVGLYNLINPLGPGWSHTYLAYVVEDAVQQYYFVVWPGGDVNEYQYASGVYQCKTPGVYDTFSKVSSTQFTIRKKDQTLYTFDRSAGTSSDYPAMLTSIKDWNNNAVSCTYETSGLRRLLSVSHGGRSLSFLYRTGVKSSLVWKVEDPTGRLIEFNYDDVETNLTSFKDAKNQLTTYEYDQTARQDHLLLRVQLPRGNYITNSYTGKKVTSQAGALSLSFSYAPNHTTISDQGGRQWNHFYTNNPKASLISQIVYSGGSVQYSYGDNNNPTLPTQIVDGNSHTTTIAYDLRGNELTITQPLTVVHQFSYNSTNDLIGYTNPRGQVTSYGYDANGNLLSIQDPRGTTHMSYFSTGLIQTISDPLSQTTTLGYNSYGNVTSARDNLNHTTQYGYDPISRLTNMTNAKGQTSGYGYDNNDLLISETNAANQQTSNGYDLNDNLLSITNPANQMYSYTYNSNDLLASKSSPGLSQTTYSYDASGNLNSRTNPDNRTTNYTYDNVGRLLSMVSPSITATFGYDNNNNLTSVTGGANNLLFTFDALNRIQTTSDFFSNSVSYGYDAASNIISITYPGNKTVSYTYDNDDRLHSVQIWSGQTFTYNYRADGTLQSIDYPNGSHATYSYDAASRLTGITNTNSGGQIICSYAFTLDELGNHLSVTQNEPLALGSLPAGITSYSYDGGNRIQSAGGVTFSFDPNGNMITRSGANNATYTYDTENRLTGITGANTTTYVYDAFGNRRSATRNGVTTQYVLDVNGSMSRVLMEQDPSRNPINYYIYGLGLLARIKPDGTIHYYYADSRGSTAAMTDVVGNITHKYSYGPFGEVLASVEQDFNPFRYVGGYGVMDDENGLYYMRARYYDPHLGRFLNEDPILADNLYVYGENNPLMKTDPKGTMPLLLVAGELVISYVAAPITKFLFRNVDKLEGYVVQKATGRKWRNPYMQDVEAGVDLGDAVLSTYSLSKFTMKSGTFFLRTPIRQLMEMAGVISDLKAILELPNKGRRTR